MFTKQFGPFCAVCRKSVECGNEFDEPERTALEGIERLKKFFKEIGLPVSLKEMNIGDDRLEEMASKCTNGGKATIGIL